ncbi:MAG: hypothetical protein RIM23_00435 [Coleofasciculus sp. G3-WIS-01]
MALILGFCSKRCRYLRNSKPSLVSQRVAQVQAWWTKIHIQSALADLSF